MTAKAVAEVPADGSGEMAPAPTVDIDMDAQTRRVTDGESREETRDDTETRGVDTTGGEQV